MSYRSNSLGAFMGTPVRQYYPPYALANLSAGVEYNSWRLEAFATNVANRRALVLGPLDSLLPTLVQYARPRVIGLSLSKAF